MLKRTKLLAGLMATMMVAGVFAGCGSSSSGSDSSSTKKPEQITVWSHLGTDEVKGVNEVAQKWAKDNGIKVKVVEDKSEMQAFLQAANSSKGPDIMFGLAHDNLGTFQGAGLLSEVPNGVVDASKYTTKSAVDAVTISGKQYAVPLALETVALYYNKDKVKEVPATMEDLVAKAKDQGSLEFDINNFYNSYGFVAAGGGYVYKNNNGTLDPKDIGLGNAGATAGYKFIQEMVTKNNLMKNDITGDIAKGDFQDGKVAYYISGPWDVASTKAKKLNFGVVPMPTLAGNPVKTFMGLQTAFVSSKSKNQDWSWKLLEYLADNSNDVLLNTGSRIPVSKKYVESDAFKNSANHEYMEAFSKQAENADPMPNIKEVQAMWTPAGNNLKLLTQGKVTPEDCAKNIVSQIKTGIAQQ